MTGMMTHARPMDGQFVEVWTYNGKLWSEVLRWDRGDLKRYIPNEDKWEGTWFDARELGGSTDVFWIVEA